MRTATLGELVSIVGGGTPSKARADYYLGAIPWVTPKDMKTWEIADSQDHISEEALAESAAKLIPAHSVLIVVRSGVLKHTLPIGLSTRPVALNQDMKALICGAKLEPRYLAYFLKSAEPTLLAFVRGTTADNIPLDEVRNLRVPLVSLTDQGRIADVLDSADAIRRKRKEAMALTDQLLRSAFLDMFGKALSCVEIGPLPAGWSRMPVDDLKAPGPYTCVGGPFGSNLTSRDYVEDGVPVIRGTNLGAKTNTFIDDGFVFVSEAKANDLVQNMAYPGDLVFTQRGTLGQVALIPVSARYPRYVVSQSQMKLTPHAGLVNSLFLHYFFCTERMQQYIASHALTTGVPHINLGILRETPVLVPPKVRQDAFARIVERCMRIRVRQTEASVCADELFKSLLHSAFRAELTAPTSRSAARTPKQLSLLE